MPTDSTLSGKVALVAGATGAIGQSIASRFAEAGAKVSLSGRRGSWPTLPIPGALYTAADLRKESDVQTLVAATIERFGRVDVLVNAQGVDYHSALADTSIPDAREVLDVNLLSAITIMKHVIPLMKQQRRGAIVNVASRLGVISIPGQAVYSASKGGLIMLSRGAAIDHARDGIRVNVVAPGMTETEMIRGWVARQPDPEDFRRKLEESVPMGRLALPEEIANAVLFLASDDSSYITGAVLNVDGGYTAA